MTPTRRTFLLAAALTASPALMPTPSAHAARDDDEYDTLRLRWLDIALGAGYDPAAEPYAARLAETGELARGFRRPWPRPPTSLWPGHPYDPPTGITQSYSRLWTMTQAYVQQGTGSTGDAALRTDILRGLDHLSATVYNPSTTRYGNWWEWQIGSPRLLMDIMAALYGELTAERIDAACAAVDHFIPDSMLTRLLGHLDRRQPRRPVPLRRPARHPRPRPRPKIALARDALSPVFPYVTKGDGLYADGSFVQHTWVAYSGTYGQVLLDGLGRLFALLAGSTWEVTDAEPADHPRQRRGRLRAR